MTLKISHDHRTQYECIKPKRQYRPAAFQRSSINRIWESANIKGFCQDKKCIIQISLLNIRLSYWKHYTPDCVHMCNNPKKFELDYITTCPKNMICIFIFTTPSWHWSWSKQLARYCQVQRRRSLCKLSIISPSQSPRKSKYQSFCDGWPDKRSSFHRHTYIYIYTICFLWLCESKTHFEQVLQYDSLDVIKAKTICV